MSMNVSKVSKGKLNDEVDSNIDVETKFFAVSNKKFIIMSIATLGIYEIYWFYKNWSAVKKAQNSKIFPFWRAVFSVFFCYSLFKKVLVSASNHNYRESFSPGLLAILYIFFIIIGTTSGDDVNIDYHILSTYLYLVSFLSIVPLVIVQKAIHYNNKAIDDTYVQSDKFSKLEIFFAVVGSILLIITLIPY